MRDAANGMAAMIPALICSRTFSAAPDQVPQSRRFLASLLAGLPPASEALVCLSELVTNALQHSRSALPGGTFTVRAALSTAVLHVEVEDGGGPWEAHPDPTGQRGRGLLIVSQFARAWGRAGDSDSGWVVWFEMDLS